MSERPASTASNLPATVRVGAVQYRQQRISSFEEFLAKVEYFVGVVADYQGDFVVFPEFFTLQWLSIPEQKLSPAEAVAELTRLTPRYIDAMKALAQKYRINIIGGSHPMQMPDGSVQNICHVFLRDGSVHQQAKIHATPSEAGCWNVTGGNALNVIQTDCGPIGVLICYDSEFPELARHLVDQGALILFVPFCTDDRQGYLRVRYCSQARAVENQFYVVLSGNTGNLPGVANMDIQYAQSAVLTPCDFPFARDGIAVEASAGEETVVIADLQPAALLAARERGTVKNLRDRRQDLYTVQWHGQ